MRLGIERDLLRETLGVRFWPMNRSSPSAMLGWSAIPVQLT